MLKRCVAILALLLFSSPAWAGDTPLYQPAENWVLTAPTPDLTKLSGASPILLVDDIQTRIEGNKNTQYIEITNRVASAQMLDQIGSLTIDWNPDLGDLIVHSVEILRADGAVDVLKEGAKFSVLRREQKLEQRVMDGLRTAVMTVPGLRVGDVLRVRYSVMEQDSALGGHVQALNGLLLSPSKVDFGRVRVLWPAAQPIRWRALAKGITATPVTRNGWSELAFAMPLPKADEVPDDAPLRFRPLPLFEVSDFASWRDVSKVMAPLFETKGLIAPGSPLAAEVEKIRSADSDPVKRTALALQLVQDKISYFFNGLNGGNYRPQTPDETWSLRYGDCKAKTVLLLAILHELGIEAEPVLAHLQLGDAIPLRLPAPAAFNHVLVRAHIAGKDYWLDGTDRGSRLANLNDIPDLRHALPVMAGGADLVDVPFKADEVPAIEADITLDSRAGIALPSLYHVIITMRGAIAQQLYDGMQQIDDERKIAAVTKLAKSFVGENNLTKFTYSFDADNSAIKINVDGITNTDWYWSDHAYTLTLDQTVTGLNFAPDRARAAWQGIPVSTGSPMHIRVRRQVLLPSDASGFSIEGDRSFSAPIAGSRIDRTVTQDGATITLLDDVRTVAPEIAPGDLSAARGVAARASANVLKVKAPLGYPDRLTAIALARKANRVQPLINAYAGPILAYPKEVENYLARAQLQGFLFDYRQQLTDLDKIVALSPSADNYSWRSNVRNALGDMNGALADARKALELEPGTAAYATALASQLIDSKQKDEAIALIDQWIEQGGKDKATLLASKADLLARAGDADGALAASDAAIAAGPATAELLNGRCWLKAELNVQLDSALKDCSRAIEQADSALAALDSRALVYFRLGRYDDAMADIKSVFDENPDAVATRYLRGVIRTRQGDVAGGQADMAAARAMWPSVDRTYLLFGIKP